MLCDAVVARVRVCAQFPIASVVAQLQRDPTIVLAYLSCMFENRKAEYDRVEFGEYHDLQVSLHVKHQVRAPSQRSFAFVTHERRLIGPLWPSLAFVAP